MCYVLLFPCRRNSFVRFILWSFNIRFYIFFPLPYNTFISYSKNIFFYIFFSIFILCDDRPTDNDETEWTKWTNEMSGVERENDYMKAKAKGSQENEKTKMFTTLIHSIHSILNTLYLHLYTTTLFYFIFFPWNIFSSVRSFD